MWTHVLNDDGRKVKYEECSYEYFDKGRWIPQTGQVNVSVSGNTFCQETGEIEQEAWLPDIDTTPVPVFNRPFRRLKIPALARIYLEAGSYEAMPCD